MLLNWRAHCLCVIWLYMHIYAQIFVLSIIFIFLPVYIMALDNAQQYKQSAVTMFETDLCHL